MITKATRRICDFQLDTPHRPALIGKQPTLEEDAIKNREGTLKRYAHDSNFLRVASKLWPSHEPCIVDTKEWIDTYEVIDDASINEEHKVNDSSHYCGDNPLIEHDVGLASKCEFCGRLVMKGAFLNVMIMKISQNICLETLDFKSHITRKVN